VLKTGLTALGDGPAPFVGEFAGQPIGLERIAEPGLGPAMGDAGANQRGMKMLSILVEQRKFPARLRHSAIEVAALGGIGPRFALLLTVYGRSGVCRARQLWFLYRTHYPNFSILP
jgi:hypothetical protein